MEIEFVYFDLDDTLLDHQSAEREALADVRDRYLALFGTLSVDELQETYHDINAPLWRQYADGEIDKQTVQHQRFTRLLEAVDASHADATLVARYYMQRYAAHWGFIPGARNAFEAVADHYSVGVLTNGFAEVQEKKLDQFPALRERSDAIVLCEEVGVLKPDPAVFEHATQEAGVDAETVLYVGDSYRSDVEGAQPVGWRVAWYARHGANGRSTNERGFMFDDWSTLTQRLL
ncbi:MAG: haloacid dehalogenase [Bacteroidetes bacterium QH_10_64_19]|nr:MAG: haloacid dehalogenase [Bacteroidetes bacterium QH_10_64_19]